MSQTLPSYLLPAMSDLQWSAATFALLSSLCYWDMKNFNFQHKSNCFFPHVETLQGSRRTKITVVFRFKEGQTPSRVVPLLQSLDCGGGRLHPRSTSWDPLWPAALAPAACSSLWGLWMPPPHPNWVFLDSSIATPP